MLLSTVNDPLSYFQEGCHPVSWFSAYSRNHSEKFANHLADWAETFQTHTWPRSAWFFRYNGQFSFCKCYLTVSNPGYRFHIKLTWLYLNVLRCHYKHEKYCSQTFRLESVFDNPRYTLKIWNHNVSLTNQ